MRSGLSGAARAVTGSLTEYEELRRYKLATSPTWAHPALLSDAVVVRDADSLSVWALK